MDLLDLLQQVKSGLVSPQEASAQLRYAPFEDLIAGVNLDLHRGLRTGQGECVFAQGKSLERLQSALLHLAGNKANQPVLATRVNPEQGEALLKTFPEGEYWAEARLFAINRKLQLSPPWPRQGELMIITAGSSDLPVALEALGSARFYGLEAGLAPDIGVAGIHRLRPWLKTLDKAKILMVIAGMEGALPSVMAGLTGKPVLAVPAGIGYGISSGGFAALAAMLSSCAPGISVFNIDNGYGAAVFAARMLGQTR